MLKLLRVVRYFCRKITWILVHVAGRTSFTRQQGLLKKVGAALALPLQGKTRQSGLLSITGGSTLPQTPAWRTSCSELAPRVVLRRRAPFPPRATRNNQDTFLPDAKGGGTGCSAFEMLIERKVCRAWGKTTQFLPSGPVPWPLKSAERWAS